MLVSPTSCTRVFYSTLIKTGPEHFFSKFDGGDQEKNLEEHPGIKVGGKNVNNLRYADDTVLIAENEKYLRALLDIIERESLTKVWN